MSQPILTGPQARRRVVITTTGPPAADTQVRLTIPAAALQDSFLNQPADNYQLTFAWPTSDDVVEDAKALEIRGVRPPRRPRGDRPLRGTGPRHGHRHPGGRRTAHLDAFRGPHTLRSSGELSAGTHTLSVATSLADLNGTTLATAFG